MKLSKSALSFVIALLWGGAMLVVGTINHIRPTYGETFLTLMSSVYPGYHATATWASVIAGTAYGLVDGAICGFLIAWLYDLFLSRPHRAIPHGA